MNKYLSVFATAGLTLALPLTLYAQKPLRAALKQVTREAAAQTARRAQNAAQAAKARAAWTPRTIRRSVFLIQKDPRYPFKGSGFVVQDPITKQLWGVTARHVQEYTSPEMQVTFTDGRGRTHTFTAHMAARGHAQGADVMLLRLPPQAARVARPLPLADALPAAGEDAFSYGYGKGVFQKIEGRDILTASPAFITTRFRLRHGLRDGYCGSPLFNARGEVTGVHCGSAFPVKQNPAWHAELAALNAPEAHIAEFSLAVPAAWIQTLLRQARAGGAPGAALKINGVTVARLQPDEVITGLVVTRADRAVQFLYFNPFFDYEHLEKFLRLRPGDQVTVKITKGDKNDPYRKHFRYTFNTADGSVMKENAR